MSDLSIQEWWIKLYEKKEKQQNIVVALCHYIWPAISSIFKCILATPVEVYNFVNYHQSFEDVSLELNTDTDFQINNFIL